MQTSRFVAMTVLGWIALVLFGAASVIWLATTVELLGRSELTAAWLSLHHLPGLMLRLLPLCCLVGVALAVRRMESRSERTALWLLGHGVARTGAVVAVLGLAIGVLGFFLHWDLVADLERQALSMGGQTEEGWVWLDSQAVRVDDGVVVDSTREALRVGQLQSGGSAEIPEAWISLRPELAPWRRLLASDGLQHSVEIHGRLVRVLACSLMAFWAWLPSRGRSGLLEILVMGLGWSLVELVMSGLTRAQVLPVLIGAWFPALCLVLLCVTRAHQCQRLPQSRWRT